MFAASTPANWTVYGPVPKATRAQREDARLVATRGKCVNRWGFNQQNMVNIPSKIGVNQLIMGSLVLINYSFAF